MHPLLVTGYTRGQTFSALSFSAADGHLVSLSLCQPVTLFAGRYSPYSLCRLCVSRLPLRNLEKVLLTLLLDETECGLLYGRSYGDLGRLVGKCAHSVESAVARLREIGFVVTARVGRAHPVISISCDAFVRWAEQQLSDPFPESAVTCAPPVETAHPAVLPRGRKPRADKRRRKPSSAAPDSSAPSPVSTCLASAAASVSVLSPAENSASDADVPKEMEDATPQNELESALEQNRKEQVALFTREDGTLYPGTYLDAGGLPHFDPASGYPYPPFMVPSASDDLPVDPSQEIAATRAAAGRAEDEEDDEDELSFGAETAETDMNPTVRINPDI